MSKFMMLLAALSLFFPAVISGDYAAVPREESRIVTVLTYHNFSDIPVDNDMTVTVAAFENQLRGMKDMGYTAITMRELINYAEYGNDLPEKPLLITLDDGYESNYLMAYEVLKKLDMPAVISVVGWSVGKTTRLDGTTPITPHFSWETAKKMYESGLIEIQNHSYDMHSTPFDSPLFNPDGRYGVLSVIGESEADYRRKLKADVYKNKYLIETNVGNNNVLFCYPYGLKNDITESVLKELGFKITMTTKKGVNYIRPGSSLYSLNRITVYERTTPEWIDSYVKDQSIIARKQNLIKPE
ncbi:MAG: chitin deacetylase [Ruminococcaceae bacterium]|nr:chitin deacetylase [Oscillospiraceae bacterium]